MGVLTDPLPPGSATGVRQRSVITSNGYSQASAYLKIVNNQISIKAFESLGGLICKNVQINKEMSIKVARNVNNIN